MLRLLSLFTLAFSISATALENDKYIPSSCNTLMGFDVAKIAQIPEMQALLNDNNNVDLKELKSFGLSPENISSVIIGMDTNKAAADPMAFQQNPDIIVIATMKTAVEVKKILATAQKEKVAIQTVDFKGSSVNLLTKDGQTMAMTTLGANTLVIGGQKMVEKSLLLKQGASTDTIQNNKELATLIKKDKMIWVVGTLPALPAPTPEQAMQNPMANAATQIKAFTLDGDYNKDLSINANLICKTAQAAAQLSAMGQMILGMATSNPQSPIKPGAIKLVTEESTIKISLDLDQATLKKISAMAAPKTNAPK